MHLFKGFVGVVVDLIERILTPESRRELSHLVAAMEILPGEHKFPEFGKIAGYGHQQLLRYDFQFFKHSCPQAVIPFLDS